MEENAMAEYKNLYDFLIEKDNDYDTYDTYV